MVGVFKRSLSFQTKINPIRPSKPPISHHFRSISLPCQSHPLISQLKDGISELSDWASKPDSPNSVWICNGLNRLKDIHDCLDDIVQLPQTQERLRRQRNLVEKLLEDFLRFVDVYGIFQTSVLGLKEEMTAAQVAIRKRDELKIQAYIKAGKKMDKEMCKLVSAVRSISRSGLDLISVGDAEIVDAIGDVVEVTVMVSLVLFNGIAMSIGWRKTTSWLGLRLRKRKDKKMKVEEGGIEEFKQVGLESLWSLRKKGDEEVRMISKKMQELEICVGGIETCCEKLFRSLIGSRVSLLNTLTN